MRSCLHFIKKPNILDRNHGLVRESLDQFDLFVGERLRQTAHEQHDADRRAFAHQRDTEGRAMARYFLSLPRKNGIFPVFKNIGDMDGFALLQHATGNGRASGFDCHVHLDIFTALGGQPVTRGPIIRVTFLANDCGDIGFA